MTPFAWRTLAIVAAVTAVLATTTHNDTAAQERDVPRFASVRASEVNMRTGPGRRYPIDWVLVKRSQPVEIIADFEDWRQVRDWQGDIGWVHRSMLRSDRTVIFTERTYMLLRRPRTGSDPVAEIGTGVVATLMKCEDGWCRVKISGAQGTVRGWAAFNALWGVRHTQSGHVAAVP